MVCHELVSNGFRGRMRKEMLFPPSGEVFDGWVMVWLGFAQWCLVASCLVISVVRGFFCQEPEQH